MAQRIIINADDCGKSGKVNIEIEKCIKNRKISSTTIMANMPAFDGAVKLYREYKNFISFGWHVNLTEGKPLTNSQLLLDTGYYVEKEGKVFFNGKSFWRKFISPSMSREIVKELKKQYEVLCDNGISISHVDSHQHIHTSPGLFFLFPGLLKQLHIERCRRIRNNVNSVSGQLVRKIWTIPYKLKNVRMTDSFCSFIDYCNIKKRRSLGETIELMVHPGHDGENYKRECELLVNTDLNSFDIKIISFRDI